MTAERELKPETPVRESSTREPTREPTPREKSVKHVTREEKREREDSEVSKKRDKEKEKRVREKRPSSPPVDAFEGDLSSVSNSSNGSIQTADVVVVDDHRGERITNSFTLKLDYNFNIVLSRIKTSQDRSTIQG